MIFINTTIFFLIYILGYISISEYGSFFNKFFKVHEKENFTTNFFFGLIIIFFLSFLIRATIGYNEYINVGILLFGITLSFKNLRTKIKYLVIPCLLFPGILISKTHDDFVLYHYSYLNEFSQSNLILGLGNIDPRYSYSSLFVYIQAIFKLPTFDLAFFHVPIFLVYSGLINYLFFKYHSCKNNFIKFFIFFIHIFLLIKFKRLGEFGYDYLVQFILIFIFIELYQKGNDPDYNFKKILLFLFLISTKITAIFFSPIILFFLYIKNFFHNLRIKYFYFLLIFLVINFTHNFLNIGCIHYVIPLTCFSSDNISWVISVQEFQKDQEMIYLWAKNFYHQYTVERIEDKISYLKNFIWIKHWFYRHFIEKIIESILIIFFLYFFLYLFTRKKLFESKEIKKLRFIFFAVLISVFIWFLLLPQFRFGFFIIYLLIFFLLNLFTKRILILSNKFYTYLICVVILFFIVNNLIRINSEFKRQDEFKYKNFPWFQLVDRQFKTKLTGDLLYFVPTDKILSCYNIPSICSLNSIKIKSNNYLHRNIYIITN